MYVLRSLSFTFLLLVTVLATPVVVPAQEQQPLTSKEFVSWLYQLPRDPNKRDELIEEIRKRGIGFALTDGMRGLVATKSGNDSLLKRTLEEAERRRVNPTASTRPTLPEANELLERTRNVTLMAANAMPDFLVKQLIKRSIAFGNTTNWIPQDNLAIAVGYRANVGEEYKLLSVNGIPPGDDVKEGKDYTKHVRGATSTGVEYISAVADVFKPESKTEFRVVDTDTLQARRTVVYEYVVQKDLSRLSLTVGDTGNSVVVGSRGRIWIDRELDRVLRFEQIATEIPGDFPIRAASTLIDYDWVTINERKYLLPTRSEILLTTSTARQVLQSRNDVRFRNYQKFSAELKVVDEVDGDDEPAAEEPPPPPKLKPATPKPDKPQPDKP